MAAHNTTADGDLASVFGLDVACELSVPFLRNACSAASGRHLELAVSESDTMPVWPMDAQLLCDERTAEGTIGFRIEAHPDLGHRIWGEGYGVHLIDVAANQVRCTVAREQASAGWQRLLVAQTLPFVAVLRGLEVFHAGAIVWGDRAIAFVGPSGAGKTSVVRALCERGAGFLTDDVLALEQHDSGLVGHPGPALCGIDREQVERLPEQMAGTASKLLAVDEREWMLPMPAARGPAELAALFYLQRLPNGPAEPHFEAAADAQPLLTATFNFVLDQRDRLQRLLDVCAMVARLPVERVTYGAATDPRELASVIAQRLDGRR